MTNFSDKRLFPQEIIRRKRDGQPLADAELRLWSTA